MLNTRKVLESTIQTLNEAEELILTNPESEEIAEKAQQVKALVRSIRGRQLTGEEAELREYVKARAKFIVGMLLDMA